MKSVLYPGTFDPMTLGHSDLVARAARLFDEVVVAIASNPNKKPLLSLEQRILLAQQSLSHLKNVRVIGFSGLLVNLAKTEGIHLILRGVRASSDFEFEVQLASMNRSMMPELETIFLTPCADYAHVSSTLVREIAAYGGDIRPFVAPAVQEAMQKLVK